MTEPEAHRTPADRLLDGFAAALRNRKEPGGVVQTALRWLRRLTTVATFAYVGSLAALLLAVEWFAESNWLLWAILYVPPQVLLLPIAVLLPPTLLLRPWQSLAYIACVPLVLLVYMDFEWSRWEAGGEKALTVLSNNIGQKQGHPLTPFVEREKPDIIALQEARGRGPGYVKQYAGLNTGYHGEFILASRFPIVESALVEDVLWGDQPVAARFVLDIRGALVAVFNVHLPSPRKDLRRLRGRRFFGELLRVLRLIPRTEEQPVGELASDRADLGLRLAERIRRDELPVLVAGDLNVPSHGAVYHRFASFLTDAFEAKGKGYGFTFPGETRNPLTLFGPWLRLDYVLAGPGWRPLYCRAEPLRRSQHRAVVARLEWVGQ